MRAAGETQRRLPSSAPDLHVLGLILANDNLTCEK